MFIFIFCSFDYARMLVPINVIFCIHHLQSSVAVVQLSSCVWLFVTPWTAACQSSLSFTISWSLPKFMFIASVMPFSHCVFWSPLLLLPSIFPSFRDFSNESSVYIRWQNIGASASVLPVNIQGWSPLRFTGLISLLSKGLSGVFSSTTVRGHQFFGVLPTLQVNLELF